MALQIIWTPEADKEFQRIITYLEKEWSEKEIIQFVETTDKIIDYISEYPLMFRKTDKRNVHEALVTEHNLLVYKVYKDRIDLITFWDTRRDPEKKKF